MIKSKTRNPTFRFCITVAVILSPLHLLPNRGILCVLRVVLMVILYARLHPSLALSLVRIRVLLQRNGNKMYFSMSAHVILQGFLLNNTADKKRLGKTP